MDTGIGDDLAYALSNFLRENGGLSAVADVFVGRRSPAKIRHAAGLVLEESLSNSNVSFLIAQVPPSLPVPLSGPAMSLFQGYLNPVILKAMELAKMEQEPSANDAAGFSGAEATAEAQRLSVSLIEACLRHSPETSLNLITIGALDHLLEVIKKSAHLEVPPLLPLPPLPSSPTPTNPTPRRTGTRRSPWPTCPSTATPSAIPR